MPEATGEGKATEAGLEPRPASPGIPKPLFTLSVREMVEFVLRRGDLGGEGDFVSPSRAVQGTRGHQRLQKARPPGYQKEVPLQFDLDTPGFTLRLQGRIDGVLPATAPGDILPLSASAPPTGSRPEPSPGVAGPSPFTPEQPAAPGPRRSGLETPVAVPPPLTLIEEIKTVTRAWDGVAHPLHWAQLKVYGAMYLAAYPASALSLRLTYLNLDTEETREFDQDFPAADLISFLTAVLDEYRQWLEAQQQWLDQRDASIRPLPFPFADYRPGQRRLAVAVYRALRERQRLFTSAPTGIGKTVSVLYPAIKALPERLCARIFYLTARTSGVQAAERALAELRQRGLRLRSVTLTAKSKICFQQDPVCEARTCPFARGYFDRIRPALVEALTCESLTRPALEEIARRHEVCPFELSLDAARWVEVVIGDYNYVFDPKAYLRRFFAEVREDYFFLVDEAHNLVDRAREMFSAALVKEDVLAVRRALRAGDGGRVESGPEAADPDLGAPASHPAPADELALGEEAASAKCRGGWPGTERLVRALNRLNRAFLEKRRAAAAAQAATLVETELDESWNVNLRHFLSAAEEWLAKGEPAPFREALLEFYFGVVGWIRAAEWFDERYRLLWETAGERMRLFCLDPSRGLRHALERGRSAVFFSATLSPLDYFREVLGGENGDGELRLASPFPPEHLGLFIQHRIATTYRSRENTFDAVASAIGRLAAGRGGNYLVFFPSYQYLNQVRERFVPHHPDFTVQAQTPGMTPEASEAFLAAFEQEPTRTQIGFAVLGGLFGEGIDLVGDRLTGVVVVGVGLPQVCLERDLIRDFFQQRCGAGFEYAYVYPGINRVLQAAGRVIRSETDRGVVLLIDTRFAEHRHRRLFPPWWRPRHVRDNLELSQALVEFWNATPPATPVA